jgi:glycosyltransferase involved in cell wall biosynthesis
MQPLVSVIIPTYNYAHYINQAIDSVLNQTYPKELIEIIVVDDGSTDNTKEVLDVYVNSKLIEVFYQKNQGKANATYEAVKKTKGKYIFNLDADDYFYPQKIELSVKIFEQYEDVVHVSSPARTVYDDRESDKVEQIPAEISEVPVDGNWLASYFFEKHMLFGGGSTYAARATALKQIEIPTAVDMYIDEFLLLAIFPLGKSYFIKQPLSIWRGHNTNYSGKTVTPADKTRKGLRLLSSSQGVLDYLVKTNFNKRIIDIYRLHHLTRAIAFKEGEGTKTVSDIIKYSVDVFVKIRPGANLIKNYYVVNRLLPTGLLKYLKSAIKGKK